MTPPARPTGARRVLTSYPARLLYAAGIVAALVGAYKAGTGGDQGAPGAPRPAQTAAAPTSVASGQIGEGVWLVGADITPGTYRSTGAIPDRGSEGYCMWSRHSSRDGGPMDDIVASDGNFGAGQMIVTIAPSDALFRTDGCAPFEKIS